MSVATVIVFGRMRRTAPSCHAAGDEPAHDVLVVDNLVEDVNLLAREEGQDLVHHADGHADAGAEASGVGEDESHDGACPVTWTPGARDGTRTG